MNQVKQVQLLRLVNQALEPSQVHSGQQEVQAQELQRVVTRRLLPTRITTKDLVKLRVPPREELLSKQEAYTPDLFLGSTLLHSAPQRTLQI